MSLYLNISTLPLLLFLITNPEAKIESVIKTVVKSIDVGSGVSSL
jgi:hypothetical protein